MRKIIRFLLHYKLFSLAIIAVVAGLILELTKLHTIANWIIGITALIPVIPLLMGMWQDLRTGRYGIDILAITAIVASIALRQYWTAIVIVVMLTGGEALDDYAGHRAQSELDALLSRVPQTATIIRGGKTLTVQVSEIRTNDRLVIKPGDVIPADAVITEGVANFDESSITGESLPQVKKVGDELLSGSVNIDGALTARCIRSAKDSQYEQIIKLVRSAAASQAPIVRLADRYSVPFTVISYIIAGGAWIISHQAIRFLEVIVVATPCPLLLAAPIAIISGMSRAAKHGIIIKTGSALEQLARAKTIAFDKTGTLTFGELSVDEVVVFRPFTKKTLLSMAASLEQNSNHVLAKAIVNKASATKTKIPKAKKIKEVAGQGLTATVSGREILVGRIDFLKSREVEVSSQLNKKTQSQTATYVAIDGQLAGFITFTDTIRPESKQTISSLQRFGIKNILMITGDNLASAD